MRIDGQVVGSSNMAQNFTLPIFFHERNESQSASGLDPDITVQMADSQIQGISNATGIPVERAPAGREPERRPRGELTSSSSTSTCW